MTSASEAVGTVDDVVVPPLDPSAPVSVLLWDADGVLQHPKHLWGPQLEQWGGDGFAEALFRSEVPALKGDMRFRDALTQLLTEWPQVTASVDDLLSLWEMVERDDDAVGLVRDIAASGVTCMLATNQQDHRKAFLRANFGYDDVFARSYHSCDMGTMKPEPAYFQRILADLGLEDTPERVGFVDDNAANIETARSLGIRAVHHDPATGVAGLRADLGWSP
ncbi:putative hydrolase of the HAD superfamily [Knoellia remsis]|uniref:Putative hydrolase of the HAD superfamily n=1 Tax=Knoellia remsis TaxID=407159 RepID=A0A2T0V0X4_9MICO|nr:HAD-IA family hydrolase [Knoellia remsis]PRY63835.1 putative hydrolase of the HAD superfamily [Knoellia remsis]